MRYLMIAIIAFLLFLSREYKNKKLLYFSAIILILYSAFRVYIPGAVVGNDYISYHTWYNDLSVNSLLTINNFLFNLFLFLVKIFFNNYEVAVFLECVLLIFSVYYFSIKITNDNRYTFAIFVFLSFGIYDLSMSAIRQWVAGSIFLIAFEQIIKKDFKKYFIMILIASLFHNSAIGLLIVYPVVNLNIDLKKKIILEFLLTFLIYISLSFKLDVYLISLIDKTYLLKYLNTKDGALYANYTVFIISSFCFIMMYLQRKKYKENVQNYKVDYNYIMLLIITSLLATKSALACRFQQYFMPSLMLAIPGIVNTFEGKKKIFFYVSAVICLMLVYIF